MVLVQTQLLRYCLCHRLCIAGQHDRLAHTGGLQSADGFGAVGLYHVRDQQITRIAALYGNVHDGAHALYGGHGDAQLFHQAGVTGGNGPAIYLRGHAMTAQFLHVCDPGGVDGLAIGSLDAQGDGVLRPAFRQRGGFHQRSIGHALGGVDASDLKCTLRQGAGLIEHHNAGACQLFQIGRTLDEDAAGGSAADAAEEAQRDGDDQRTGAADDKEGQSAVDPIAKAGGLSHKQQHHRRQESQRQCAVADGGGVHPGKAGDKVFRPGLFHAGIFHKVENFRDGRFTKFLGGAHLQQAGHVHAAADDLVPGVHVTGQAFAGQGGSVQGRTALHDDAVNGHPLAGLHHDDGAHLDLIRVHLFQLAVLALDVGVVRADVHQAGNALAAFAHGDALEQLTDLVEDDNGAALHIIAQRKRAHGGDRHQEALVKGLTVLDALQRLAQHVPAYYKVGDAVERQLNRHGQGGQKLEHDHQRHGDQDPLKGLFLFLVHKQRSSFWGASGEKQVVFHRFFGKKMGIPQF